MPRRCRAGEIVDAIEGQVGKRIANITVNEVESIGTFKMIYVMFDARFQAIETPDFMTLTKKFFA